MKERSQFGGDKQFGLEKQAALSLRVAAVFTALSLLSFSRAQKRWIKRRDKRCRFPEPHDCHGRLEVHHIKPQMWARKVLGWHQELIDAPENGVTLCGHAHKKIIHREMSEEEAKSLCANREPYWDTAYDAALAEYAARATQEYLPANPWPKKR